MTTNEPTERDWLEGNDPMTTRERFEAATTAPSDTDLREAPEISTEVVVDLADGLGEGVAMRHREHIARLVRDCAGSPRGMTLRHARHIADAVLAALSTQPAAGEVESQEEFDALPVGTLVRVVYHGKGWKKPESMQILRVSDNGASSGGAGLRGGKFWSEVWGWADSVTVLYQPPAPTPALFPGTLAALDNLNIRPEVQ